MPAGLSQTRTAARRPWRRARALPCLLGLALLLGAADSLDEYEVKAGFLFNFARYTIWPKSIFEDTETSRAPFVFGIAGTDPFKHYLDAIAKTQTIDGRKIVIRRFEELEDLEACQLLFIGRSMEKHREALLEAIAKQHVFTVSEMHGFARDGGIARFQVESGRVKFEINTDAAKRAGLRINSQLLKIAIILEDDE